MQDSTQSSESEIDARVDTDISEDTRRTVLTSIMATVYSRIPQQMEKEIEQTSSTSTQATCILLSDDIALHGICAWALTSVTDNITQQLKRHIN